MTNPLLIDTPLPRFNDIQAESVEPAITEIIERNLKAIDALVEKEASPTWATLVAPIEDLDDKLNNAWSPVGHLNAVMNTQALRQAYNNCLPKLSDYGTKVGQNQRLYEAYVALKGSKEYASYNAAEQKVISNAIRDFKLSGVALEKAEREKFAQLSQKLSELQSQFQDNVMDATDHWHLDVIESQMLAGLPEQAMKLAKQVAEKAGVSGWRLTLDFPCYQSVITYADNRNLRQKIHEAYFTRASDKGPDAGKWDNSAKMEEILATRHEMAKLLGFNNYAERSLAKKMAKTPHEVMNFLLDLAKRAKPFAEKEFTELQNFAKAEFDVEKLEPWDIAYYSEKLRQKRFAISQETLRPYFPLPTVLVGMFEVVKRLYGISIEENTHVEKWHPDVRFFEIFDENKQLRGQFYLDLFARNFKRGGAWMDEARVRRLLPNGKIQTPVAYLTCNFRAPIDDAPSLLTHDEVLTLFHEFGHGLHHMLTKIDCAGVSGINGVAWDAVELPSQFMENWCWQKEALTFISGHYQTFEPLPNDLLEKMTRARNFQSGMMLLRQLEFSLFDFRIHLEYSPEEGGRIQEILDEVRKDFCVVPIAPYARFQHSFGHIFAGGYAAGYYSYLWAEVLSQDAFAKFEEDGIFNPETGQAFLQKILEKGGSEDAENLFVDFRGREADVTPLLRHRGLVA
ncbi:MAG: oligopeptidase A [Gammaproteobacteria bacterium 39-13]|nr:oligopeptidase A [Gammaproteobacteria bacterium]OJV88279.1 MAG: oligopeptidase A [Gammaproteobacteria bacterium 39-13]